MLDAVATVQKQGASERRRSSAAISSSARHRATRARNSWRRGQKEKVHTSGSRQCARRHRSQGWTGPLYGCRGRNCRSGSQARSSPSRTAFRSESIGTLPNRPNTCCGTLMRGRRARRDKLGMMCCVSGRGLDGFGASLPPRTAETAHEQHGRR